MKQSLVQLGHLFKNYGSFHVSTYYTVDHQGPEDNNDNIKYNKHIFVIFTHTYSSVTNSLSAYDLWCL